jgi:hypothetical protein
MIATVAEIRIEEEREHVVNPQKHSNHVDHFAFTTIGTSITSKDMRHSCGMRMTRMKNEMRSPYISLNSLRKISKSPSFIQYERNK